ncbi:MAG: S41 family peptidase [Planctomycetes bacterium]|nr:S41 family peptidase [Planctomycetota bacterium]
MDRLDPDSAFLDEAALQREKQIEAGELGGLGLAVRISPKPQEGGEIRRVPVVVAAAWNGPAARAGIRPLDELWEVNGKSVLGKDLVDIEGLLAGTPGSAVTLTLYHRGWFRERKVSLIREKLPPAPVLSQPLPGKLWILKASVLLAASGEELARETARAREAGSAGLLLDLRDNAGGPLEAVPAAAAAFLAAGAVVCAVQGRDAEALPPAEFKTPAGGETALPLVVLVNEGTAGTAEILAGALHDGKRASLVGVQTFGQGTVQKTFPLKSLDGKGALRLTVGRLRLPAAGDFHGKGLAPDHAAAERRSEIWRQDELAKVLEARHVETYLDERFEKNLELFQALAESDGRDPSRYPGFDAWFKATGTKAEPDDLRGLLRAEVRRRLAGRLGRPLFADLQEDEQLQAAVAVLAKAAGLDLATVPEYAPFAKKAGGGK